MSSRPVTNNQYVELAGPTSDPHEMNAGCQTSAPSGSSIKSHAYGANSQSNKTNAESGLVGIFSLKEGQYNESESHEGFLEALNAWRNAGKKSEEPAFAKSSKKVKF